ncbi:MAG: YggT family protein [Gemmataceae bacterium]|nr:YggT family protein [Gemmataceae bacterium]
MRRLKNARFAAASAREKKLAVISYIFNAVVDLYSFVVLLTVVMSWLLSFGVITRRNAFVDSVWRTMEALTEPVLRQIRRFLPSLGGLDLSPVVLLIGLRAVQIGVNKYILAPLLSAGL